MSKFTIKDFAMDMLKEMPESKKQVLRNALDRNFILTSARLLSWGTMTVYKQGWYLELDGCRCGFKVWAADNDGEFVFGRKPVASKLDKIYDKSISFNEGDFDNI